MIITFTYSAAPTPPLGGCDCIGALVYLKFKPDYRQHTRDGHGVVRGTLVSRSQSSNGTWTYSFAVDPNGLVSPMPSIGGGMIESVCCQGCLGYAAESYNQDQFGARLVAPTVALPAAGTTLPVQHLIRAFHLEDWRAWLDTPATTTDITIHLFAGAQMSVNPLTIRAGEVMSDRSFSFLDGRSCRISEDAHVMVKLITTDPAARGLEVQFWGHPNPSVYFSPHVALGTGPVSTVQSYDALLTSPIGTEFHLFPYVYKKTSWGISRLAGDTEFPIP